MKVKCPFCGDMIDKRGFESHQNSYRCIARRTIKEYEQKGYVVFNDMRANNNLTKNNEVLKIIIKDITGYFSGHWNHPGGFTYGYWGPKWLMPLWNLNKDIDKKIFDKIFIESIRQNNLTEEALAFIAIKGILKSNNIRKKDKKEIVNMIMNGKFDEAIAVAHLKHAGRF